MRRLALTLLVVLASACHKKHKSGDESEPAPSSSVISLAFELGACTNVPACDSECDAGSADRCRRLAVSYAFGKGGVDKDEARATALYVRACDMKDPSACVFAGQMNEFSRGVPKNDARAALFYERACDLKYAPGCFNLAVMYERGTGVVPDRKKAGDLYQIACTAGSEASCAKAKEMRALVDAQ